ncbi:hypothetical protein ACC671_22115 [Rhizobium ruizarguesonis]|uniref:hypothetical protein n=1 Tax=Rhizobium leguminosarum TaxID=384 RepID=UPI001C925067|nr:hypothetical protein [Rhizobium leguminosarum]MBY3043180.1 hypothetical protein [Rhizobium leguminosarum]
MSTTLVAFPVIKDARKFHLEKGRRWTVVEHILLEALAKSDWSIKALTDASSLPRRVVLEVVIRLMRAGWVELKSHSQGIIFCSTPRGRVYATREELPPVTRSTSRYMGYAVDLFCGNVFRARDLITVTEDQWRTRREQGAWAELPAHVDQDSALPDVRVLADKLLESDEHLTRVEVQDWRPHRRFAIVSVRNGAIDGGLGEIISDDLKSAILAAADAAQRNVTPVLPRPRSDGQTGNRILHRDHQISFRTDDIIVGGHDHSVALNRLLAKARHRVIVHSTFIRGDKIDEYVGWFTQAIQKGAIVDVLWGQSKERDGVNDTRKAASALKEAVSHRGFQDRIRVHTTPTRSHAKIILADTGDLGSFSAIVGSCNWLYTDFKSADVSIRLHDANIVSDVAFDLAELARPRDGQIPELSVELVRLGYYLAGLGPSASSRGTARIITAPEHARIFTDAREEAQEKMLLVSHRLDAAAKPAIIKMGSSSQNGGPVLLQAMYERADTLGREAQVELAAWANGKGVRLIQRQKTHGKALAWDADNVLISSLNMLSADPGDREPRNEIGVLIRAPNAARVLHNAFENAVQNSEVPA